MSPLILLRVVILIALVPGSGLASGPRPALT